MKKKVMLLSSVAVIILVTLVLVFLLPGGGKKEDSGEAPVTEQAPDVSTEKTEERSEKKTESVTVTEEQPVVVTRATTEEVTTEVVIDGSGHHTGKLGSSYDIPEGFQDVSPKEHEEGYYYIYKNPEYDMTLQVAEFHSKGKEVSFETEYSVLHNLYKTDVGTYVTYDKKEENHYVISGYTENQTKVFYVEGFKQLDRNEVQIYSEYPNDRNKAACDRMLEVLQDTYQYYFVENPD